MIYNPKLEVIGTAVIESENYPYEFEIIKVQLKDEEDPENIRHNETKLFYIKR